MDITVNYVDATLDELKEKLAPLAAELEHPLKDELKDPVLLDTTCSKESKKLTFSAEFQAKYGRQDTIDSIVVDQISHTGYQVTTFSEHGLDIPPHPPLVSHAAFVFKQREEFYKDLLNELNVYQGYNSYQISLIKDRPNSIFINNIHFGVIDSICIELLSNANP